MNAAGDRHHHHSATQAPEITCGHLSHREPERVALEKMPEAMRWIAQTVHQGWHGDHGGTFETCPKSTCRHAAEILAAYRAAGGRVGPR